MLPPTTSPLMMMIAATQCIEPPYMAGTYTEGSDYLVGDVVMYHCLTMDANIARTSQVICLDGGNWSDVASPCAGMFIEFKRV